MAAWYAHSDLIVDAQAPGVLAFVRVSPWHRVSSSHRPRNDDCQPAQPETEKSNHGSGEMSVTTDTAAIPWWREPAKDQWIAWVAA